MSDLCGLGDKTVEAEAAKFYNKKDKDGNKIDKGIAFPTCVSVNNQVCHNSPWTTTPRSWKRARR